MAAKKKAASKKATPAVTPAAARKMVGAVHVDSTTARDDHDVHLGHFATTSDGRYGVFTSVVSTYPDGYPDDVTFVTRDEHAETITVKYSDLTPAQAGQR